MLVSPNEDLTLAKRTNLSAYLEPARPSTRTSSLLGVAALALAGSAVVVNRRAAQAERDYLPKGRFVTVEGVRLHYVEKGSGPPVVFLHGNGAMLEDMLISGVFRHAATAYRALVFDRPGIGHSERPKDRHWTAAAQASLFARTFATLGLGRPIVVGHSWGALVALALALNHPINGRLGPGIGLLFSHTAQRCRLVLAAGDPRPRRSHQLHGSAADRRGHRLAADRKDVRAATDYAAVRAGVPDAACPAVFADQGLLTRHLAHDHCRAAAITAI